MRLHYAVKLHHGIHQRAGQCERTNQPHHLSILGRLMGTFLGPESADSIEMGGSDPARDSRRFRFGSQSNIRERPNPARQ
jgi:hypothetical protein